MQIHTILFIFTLLFIQAIIAVPAGPVSGPPGPQACVASPDWVVSSHLRPSDCVQALDMLRRAEQKDSSRPLEFIARGAYPATKHMTLPTPREYQFRSCTITVAMFASIPPWFMPPTMERRRFASSDVASLGEVYRAAEQIVTDCVQSRGRRPIVGWQEMGRLSKAIGVFVWETGSPVDRALTPWNDLSLSGAGDEPASIREPRLDA
ncbi:MAG: hypothetical protein Q9169_002241 [Polycauliona sp. 2 TL-2023]